MKSYCYYACLTLFLCAITIAGCGDSGENKLATDGVTDDEFARYEAELEAVSGGDSYEDLEQADDAAE